MNAIEPRRSILSRILCTGTFALPLAALAACSSPSPAPPQPTGPAPQQTARPAPARPAPPAPADWRNAPQTDGRWYWAMEGERSAAYYGARGGAPVARLTCEPVKNAVILWRTGQAAMQVPLAVTTTSTRKLLTAVPAGTGGAAATLTPSDPLLDAIAFSRGRFMLEMTGSSALYLPSSPELSRVIEDCRGGSAR